METPGPCVGPPLSPPTGKLLDSYSWTGRGLDSRGPAQLPGPSPWTLPSVRTSPSGSRCALSQEPLLSEVAGPPERTSWTLCFLHCLGASVQVPPPQHPNTSSAPFLPPPAVPAWPGVAPRMAVVTMRGGSMRSRCWRCWRGFDAGNHLRGWWCQAGGGHLADGGTQGMEGGCLRTKTRA